MSYDYVAEVIFGKEVAEKMYVEEEVVVNG